MSSSRLRGGAPEARSGGGQPPGQTRPPAPQVPAPAPPALPPSAGGVVGSTSDPLIVIRGMRRTFVMGDEEVHALDGVDLAIGAGEFVAIIGPSGSGKSTLMYALGLLDRPTSGSYRLGEEETASLDDAALSQVRCREIGYVFQAYHLLPHLDVLDNISLGLVYAGAAPADRRRRARELAERLGLGHRLGHRPHELSGGQMQRVAIARALAGRPRMVLADEPTGNLDQRTGHEIMALLRELHAQGHTIVLVTHDPTVAAQADRAIRIVDGKIATPPPQAEAVGGGKWEVGSGASDGPEVVEPPTSTQTTGAAPRPPPTSHLPPPTDTTSAGAGVAAGDLLRMAVREGLLAHKLRSALTVLGIVFGIAAVIAMTAITEGGKQAQLDAIRRIGVNNLQVRSPALDGARLLRARRLSPDGVGEADLAALRAHLPGVVASTAWKSLRAELRHGGGTCDDAAVLGVTGAFAEVTNAVPAAGRLPDAEDERTRARVIALGSQVARALGFAEAKAALGAQVVVGDEPFTVIGVMAEQGSPQGRGEIADAAGDRDREAYLPYATLRAYFRQEPRASRFDAIALRMDAEESLVERSLLARRIVADLHQDADDFSVAVPLASLRQAQRTKEVFNVIITVIAAISLVVGGIGIMNIMLASVTERTREIGVRRAVGASRADVLRQFLGEALVLSLSGGLLGILLGFAGGWLIELVFGFPVAFNPWIVAAAAVVSMGIGVAFGLYPAWRAARMDPVEALRT